jgi:hypothetical protein
LRRLGTTRVIVRTAGSAAAGSRWGVAVAMGGL